jgi:CAAX protease family protein
MIVAISRRLRNRSLVLVERETCETAGDMDANLAGQQVEPRRLAFPYSNWGPAAAVLGVILALGAGILLSIPGLLAFHEANGNLTTAGNVFVQFATALGFLLVPMAIAAWRGATSVGEVLARLGVRRFKPSALLWMGAAIVAYLVFAGLYVQLVVEPHQKDIAEGFGAVPFQVLLIVIAAPVSEEVCFRGMLFGGLREKLPRLAAALISALIFGGLHALTGVSAVPPLIAFGFILALLYEKTGSILPGILLHMLNNSVALLGQ